jgi:hypothetical protein
VPTVAAAATTPPGGSNIGAETLESSDGSGEPAKRPDWLAELSRKQANRRYRFKHNMSRQLSIFKINFSECHFSQKVQSQNEILVSSNLF